jgi:hypothetical protein
LSRIKYFVSRETTNKPNFRKRIKKGAFDLNKTTKQSPDITINFDFKAQKPQKSTSL